MRSAKPVKRVLLGLLVLCILLAGGWYLPVSYTHLTLPTIA